MYNSSFFKVVFDVLFSFSKKCSLIKNSIRGKIWLPVPIDSDTGLEVAQPRVPCSLGIKLAGKTQSDGRLRLIRPSAAPKPLQETVLAYFSLTYVALLDPRRCWLQLREVEHRIVASTLLKSRPVGPDTPSDGQPREGDNSRGPMPGLAVSMRRMLDLVQTAERSGLSIEQFVVLYKEQLSKQEAASLNVLVSPSRPGTPPRAPASHCGSLSGPPFV